MWTCALPVPSMVAVQCTSILVLPHSQWSTACVPLSPSSPPPPPPPPFPHVVTTPGLSGGGSPDALKVVDRCLEEQHSSVQTLNVAGGRPVPRPRVRTAPGKDSVQWSCVPHTSCVSPSLSVWRYCSASWPAGLWSGIRTVWNTGYRYVGMAAYLHGKLGM